MPNEITVSRFGHILFPVDFSERSRAAAPFVHSMASRYGSRVTLLHAVQQPSPVYSGMDAIYPPTYRHDEIRDEILTKLEEFRDSQLPRLGAHCVVEFGDPAGVIVDFAHTNRAALIALPTHGYGVFRRLLLGSVTSKVLHDATIPVWTSAHCPEPSHRAHPLPRHVLCALDLKPDSLRVLELAIEIASDTTAALEIVHAAPEGYAQNENDPARAIEIRIRELLEAAGKAELVKLEPERQTEYPPACNQGDVAKFVREMATRRRSDLVIIGRGQIQHTLGQLHANSYAIVRESPCPVLSL